MFTGWLDWVLSVCGRTYNIHTQIQLKWDLSKALFDKPKVVYVGTEFRHWRNKFDIRGVTEIVWQALVQFMF